MMRIAAHDVAGTFYSRKGQAHPQPRVKFQEVTQLLTALADAALTAALAVAVRTVFGEDPLDAKLAVMAMGKCGAGELNYISDVDVIFVSDVVTKSPGSPPIQSRRLRMLLRSRCEPAPRRQVWCARSYPRIPRCLLQAVGRDLGVPGPSQGSPADRLPAFGAGVPCPDWPDGLDRIAARLLRRRRPSHASPSTGERAQELRQRELKLGEGGLRDVEFAVQLLQLVHGRSDETLRVLSTVDALTALVAAGYVGREDGNQLIDAYEFLRLLEHRLQLERFRRTHVLPEPDDTAALKWLAIIKLQPAGQ